MSKIEQTLSIIKPDAVERNLIDQIKDILKKITQASKTVKNYKLLKMKHLNFTKSTNPNLFIMIFVLIFHLDQYLL